MMHGPTKELHAYYVDPFLTPTVLIQVDIFKIDDIILEKLGARSEFPKSNEKRFTTWFMQYQTYFGKDIWMNDVYIIG